VARRAPRAQKARGREEAQLAEPIVPIGKALKALAQVDCVVDGQIHKSCDAVLLFGRIWVPHHLSRDVPLMGTVTYVVNWMDGTQLTIAKPATKIEGLDLSWLPLLDAAGRQSLKPAEPKVGDKITSLAIHDGELETSSGYIQAITGMEMKHTVSTKNGHCCCAFLDIYGRFVSFHIRGTSTSGYAIPLTETVVKLMMSKN